MDLPITRPSQMSYGDEIDFNDLLDKLKSKRFNGFIRVTHGKSEGYILLKNGMERASSFDDYSKMEALQKIKSIVNDNKTLIEVFDIKESHMKYLMDLNKFFVIDSDSKVENILQDLKKNKTQQNTSASSPSTALNELKSEEVPGSIDNHVEIVKEQETVNAEIKNEIISEEKDEVIEEVDESLEEMKNISEDKTHPLDKNSEPGTSTLEVEEIKVPATEGINKENNKEVEDIEPEYQNELKEPDFGMESVKRKNIMKKYGLKDVGEKEVDDILETYKGGILSDDDVEKIELNLMNKIKKSTLGIPKIKGTEVMVFLDNDSELSGIINIITEYESRSLFSRIRGESKDIQNIRRQITNIAQMEIKKSFRGYHEIIDVIEINVEIS
ncbi:MAG: DUF2226 domain-containing protein [Methanobacterium sp.]